MTTQTMPQAPGVAGAVMSALESAWAAIRVRHPEVPEVVMTMGAGSVHGRGAELALGRYAPGRWVAGSAGRRLPELFVGAEGLRNGGRDVMVTLLREAARALGDVRGITTTSRQGRYHNGHYRDFAIEVGLEVARDRIRGWTETVMSPQTVLAYSSVIAALDAVLIAWRVPEHDALAVDSSAVMGGTSTGRADRASPTEGSGPVSASNERNGVVAICGCRRRIRLARSVLELGPITCGICGHPFTAPPAVSAATTTRAGSARPTAAPQRAGGPTPLASPEQRTPPGPGPVLTIEERLRIACIRLAAVRGDWVRIADVRRHLGDIDHEACTSVLQRLERAVNIHITAAVDPTSLTRADHDGAVVIDGKPMHLIRLDW